MEFERNLIFEELQELKQSGCIDLLGTEPTCFENKNSEKSLTLRKQANQLFARKIHDRKVHEEIWKLYTKSIAYASNDTEELPAGYANRSALLLHLKKYSDCLLDIERALKVTESKPLKVKLYCRQSECCVALQNGKERASLKKANFWLNKIDDPRERKKLKETIEKTEESIKIDVTDSVKTDKQYDVSCDNNAFRINYCKKYGKHLIANRNIRLGELIHVEKFYVTTINSAKFYAFCSHCLAISWSTIPCDYCSFYLYCSDKCKEQAWEKYHDIECSVKFGKHPKDHTDYLVQLGLRALIMGFKETGNIAKLKELINQIDKCTDLEKRGLTEDGKFSSDSFTSLYSLNCSKSAKRVKLFIPEVLKICVALAKNNHIFGKDFNYTNNTDLMKNENTIFIASLFVRLSSICCVNAFELASANLICQENSNFFDCVANFCCSRGLSVSLFTSLINHSCDNNVDKFYTNDGRVVYYAVQPIEKNSQIFSSYYCKFINMHKSIRQAILSQAFEFRCDCVACKNDWPSLLVEKSATDFMMQLNNEMFMKHAKTLIKISNGIKPRRCSTKTIRKFIEDTELLLKSSKRPTILTECFLWAVSMLIEFRYFFKLHIPSECKNNSKK